MKLLQILYPGLGGHSSVATSLISGDVTNSCEHFLLGYGIEKPSENLEAYNCDYVLKKPGFDWKSYKKVFKKIQSIKPDAIIVHSTSQVITVFIYSLFFRIKWLAVEHQANSAKTKMDWVYSFLILILASKVVYLTDSYKNEMQSAFPLLTKRKRIKVIANGIDLTKFVPKKRKPDGLVNISMISRLNKLRDHHTLILAFSELVKNNDNLRLKIAGDGETFNEISHLITSLQLQHRIELLGFLNEDEIVDLLHETDIYVHSSLAETQSTSLLQVMACKIPIIATDINGINNVLSHNTEALLFTPTSSVDLQNAIELYLLEPQRALSIATTAYNKVLINYDQSVTFMKYFQILNYYK